MERRAFLKLTLGLALGAGATAAGIMSAAEAAPLMVPPGALHDTPDHALATEQDIQDATPQNAQYYIVRPRRRRRVIFVRPRRRVIYVRPRRRIRYFY